MSDTARNDSITGGGGTPHEDSFGIAPGDVIAGKYEVLSRIGSGGFGAVFQARHQTIGKLVAIKVLRGELASDPQQAARFLQEARAANEVTHRNIVEVSDFGVHAGKPYMVMAYLRGETLSDLMKREKRLAPSRVIRVLSPVLRALAVAHGHGVVHRDIKPDNIFLAQDDDADEPIPKILDFGIAKRSAGEDLRLTDTNAAFGTPAYMAPEQALGARDVLAAADQYAVGALLYEALSGKLPHAGATYNAMIVAKVTTPPQDLAVVCPDLDAGLTRVVMRAIAREPSDRFATVTALREALEPYANITSVAARVSMDVRPGDESDPSLGATVPAATSDPNAMVRTPGAWTTGARATTQIPTNAGRTMLFAAIALTALCAVGTGLALRSRPRAVVAPGATTAPPRSVMFHVQIAPSNAQIVLDGVVVGHGEAEVVRPRDGARHVLHASAAGFGDLDEILAASEDTRIERQLAPVPSVAPPTEVPAPQVVPVAPVDPTPTRHPATAPATRPHSAPNTPTDSRHPRMDRNIHL